jgi:cytochrome c oxidase subunit 2
MSLAIALWVTSWPVIAADVDIAQCILCHGANANGNAAIRAPKLAGMDRWYLQRQLVAFRSGQRGAHASDVNGSEMRVVALSLREADVVSVVSQVAALKSIAPPVTLAGDAARGARLYSTCASCHGARGEGNAALNAPSLKTNDWYIVAQLSNYRTGVRGVGGSETDAQMRAMALTLPDDQAIVDVTAYIDSLR